METKKRRPTNPTLGATLAHQRRAKSSKGEVVLIGKMEHDFPYRGDGRGVYKGLGVDN